MHGFELTFASMAIYKACYKTMLANLPNFKYLFLFRKRGRRLHVSV